MQALQQKLETERAKMTPSVLNTVAAEMLVLEVENVQLKKDLDDVREVWT